MSAHICMDKLLGTEYVAGVELRSEVKTITFMNNTCQFAYLDVAMHFASFVQVLQTL